MALTNAEKQKRWRDKRNALAKLGLKYEEKEAARILKACADADERYIVVKYDEKYVRRILEAISLRQAA